MMVDNSTLHWYSDANISLYMSRRDTDTDSYALKPNTHMEKSP